MAWFKVDDKLHSHKKTARAGVAAMGLWAVAGSWCADQLADGFVPDYIAHRLAPGEADDLAGQLVDAGLWVVDEHDGDKGWRFKDWDEYQPTREDVESRREYERDKKRRQRRNDKGQFEDSRGESPGDNRGESPGESTRPDPTRPDQETEPNGSGGKPPKTVDVPEFDNPLPVGPGNGEPLYALLRTWAVDAGFVRPEDRKAAVQWQWLMTVVDEVLGDGKHSHGVRVTLCGEFAAHVTGEPLERPGWQHLRQLVSSHGGALTLAALGQACDWGAGLRPQDQGDPLSLTKYAAAILQRWAEAA